MTDVMDPPQIDPRFARRRIEVAREAGRRRLRLIVGLLAVVAILAIGVGALYSPLMRVRHIRILSPGVVTVAQVEADTGLSTHQLMIRLDAAAVAARLDAVPTLGGAKVIRKWPSTVTVAVTARRPVASVARPSGGWAEVDATGRVLADQAVQPPGLPVLSGVGTPPVPGGWITGSLGPSAVPGRAPTIEIAMNAASDDADVPRGAAAALVALQALPASIRADVISVSAGPGATLSMTVLPADVAVGSIQVSFGDGSQLAAKLTSLVTLIDQANLSGVTSIDLSVPDRPTALTAR